MTLCPWKLVPGTDTEDTDLSWFVFFVAPTDLKERERERERERETLLVF